MERGVVPDDIDHTIRAGGSADDGLHRIGLDGVRHAAVEEADREIAVAVTGGDHGTTGQALVGDVPQPARIGPVGDPRVAFFDDFAWFTSR